MACKISRMFESYEKCKLYELSLKFMFVYQKYNLKFQCLLALDF